jgi:hypothetical protein
LYRGRISFIASPASTGRNLERPANLMYPMLIDGKLMVPKRAESEDGGTIGDTWVEVPPDHPDYANWLAAALKLRAAGPNLESE